MSVMTPNDNNIVNKLFKYVFIFANYFANKSVIFKKKKKIKTNLQ